MTVYWLMYVLPLFAAFASQQKARTNQDPVWLAICVFFTFLIGFRVEVGGDWFNYLGHFDANFGRSLVEALSAPDSAYALLEWLSSELGWGIYGVNTACGAIAMAGIYQFSRRQPQRWLALMVAVPYLIIVVAMGYTRQSVAVGFELFGLLALADGRLMKYVLLILLGATFHKSAAILLPLAIVSTSYQNVWIKRFLVATTLLAMVGLIGLSGIGDASDAYFRGYIDTEMQSEGANIRVAMNALPAAIFLVFAKKLAPDELDRRTWTVLAISSLACILSVRLASTATDRIALYLIPIQLVVFSRIGTVFPSQDARTLANSIVVVGYAAALFVLLNYATWVSVFWVPYQNAAFLW